MCCNESIPSAVSSSFACGARKSAPREAQPTAFRDGILSVRVSTAAWMQELQFAKEDIRQRLNQRLGTEAVRDVYFVAGGADPRPRPAPVVVHAADDEPEEPIDLPPLRDARLSEVFTRIARAHQRRPRR